ncbi:MAG TPA: hypothetical protein DD706_18840 [Nitrospiraceae bacterium]|nr:hypothetical protein [Nitrospiraceae bacterium]
MIPILSIKSQTIPDGPHARKVQRAIGINGIGGRETSLMFHRNLIGISTKRHFYHYQHSTL